MTNNTKEEQKNDFVEADNHQKEVQNKEGKFTAEHPSKKVHSKSGKHAPEAVLIEQLKQSIDTITDMEKRCLELEDSMKRIAADKENALRIAKRDIAETRDYSLLEFVKNIVPLCDNMESARKAAVSGVKIEDLQVGLDMNIKMFLDVMKKHSVNRIEAMGQKFDPAIHQAVSEIADKTKEAGTVIDVLLPGYEMNGRLLRPAMVVVSKKE